MFLVTVNEILGYTHEQTLDTSYVLILNLLTEYSYMMRDRYKEDKTDENGQDFEWVELPDFDTGEMRKIKKYKYLPF